MKWPKSSDALTQAHVPSNRCRYQTVSSGMFAYQISRYCENAMYAQKTVSANIHLPRSW
jgi:hypothetical protein